MRANFYIDGFNLYYLRLKAQPHHKWLNYKALADRIVPAGTTVHKVKYYTAPVSGKLDPDAPKRQQALFSALRTVPEIETFHGRFLFSQRYAGLVHPPRAKPDSYVWNLPPPDVVLVQKAEEKGSDVNLGVHLVRDAFVDLFDVAYVITDDTDLVEPIRIVSQEVGKPVRVVAPCRPHRRTRGGLSYLHPVPAPSLQTVASFIHYLDDAELAAAQFPPAINRPGKKPVLRPPTWV